MLHQHHLLSVGEMLELLPRETGKSFNKTSVYRALEKLEEQGKVCQHSFSLDETKYELRQSHHDHLVCSSCGAVSSAECSVVIPPMIDDFQTNHHHLTIFGLCAECQKK